MVFAPVECSYFVFYPDTSFRGGSLFVEVFVADQPLLDDSLEEYLDKTTDDSVAGVRTLAAMGDELRPGSVEGPIEWEVPSKVRLRGRDWCDPMMWCCWCPPVKEVVDVLSKCSFNPLADLMFVEESGHWFNEAFIPAFSSSTGEEVLVRITKSGNSVQ